jgi:hypothetical protein
MIKPMPHERLPSMCSESIFAASYTQTFWVPINVSFIERAFSRRSEIVRGVRGRLRSNVTEKVKFHFICATSTTLQELGVCEVFEWITMSAT